MKKIFVGLLLVLFSCLAPLPAVVIEIDHFDELLAHVTLDTLVILDIDDTLLIPVQMLGCDEWFRARIAQNQAAGLPKEKAFNRTLAEWEAIRRLTHMEIVEPGSAEIVHLLQERGLTVMGLTTQRWALASCTDGQLAVQGVNLATTAPTKDNCYVTVRGVGILYYNGTLYSAGQPKGEALFQFCDQIGHQPKRIVFLNDSHKYLLEMEATAQARGVEFVGLRYAYSDARKAAFRMEVADYQFHHSNFARIVSDVDAMHALTGQR